MTPRDSLNGQSDEALKREKCPRVATSTRQRFKPFHLSTLRVCDVLFLSPMRRIKLSGRELAVVKALGFANAMPGSDILDYTQMQPEDVADVLNALLAAGYVESKPYREQVTPTDMVTIEFEVNPAYVHELKATMTRSWT